jgi:hypothetical protein
LACVALSAAPSRAFELAPYANLAPTDRPQSSVGLDLAASALRLHGDLTARAAGDRTFVAPQLSTTLRLAPKLSVETRIDFAEWNTHSALFDATVETKFRVRSALPFVDDIEGRIWQAPDGVTRESLHFGLSENVGSANPNRPIKLQTSATIEQTDSAGAASSTLTGIQAVLSGFASERSTTSSRLSLSYQERSGIQPFRRSSVTYNRSWSLNENARLGVDCEVTDDEMHTLKLYWAGKF